MNDCRYDPIEERDHKPTVKSALQEAGKILNDLDATLTNMQRFVTGNDTGINDKAEPQCLCDEARMIVADVYNCLEKAKSIEQSLL